MDLFLVCKNFFISSEGNYLYIDMIKEMIKNLILFLNKVIIFVNYLFENLIIRVF